jgi:branched-chain amino acid transport system ATP-binding protein
MLAIGSALICMPRVLLIDELSLGLAPVIVEDLTQRIIDIRHELSISILLVEQSVRLALEMSDYAYILENGQVALHGHSASLIANPEIQALYLGQARPDSPPQVADFQPATQGVNR